MKQFLKILALWLLAMTPVFAADTTAQAPQLQPLNIAIGTWKYHGTNQQTANSKSGNWTWDQVCSWSANRIYLVCSFSMNWPEGPDNSVAIWTYNQTDKSYWHYEVLDDYKGNKPVISRMTVAGNTWTETTENVAAGGKNTPHFRVVYQYTSPTRVEVKFQTSKDGIQWATIGHGVGIKQNTVDRSNDQNR